MVCDLKTPDIENVDYDERYKVQLLSVERMKMTNTAQGDSHGGVGIGTGTAVRIDWCAIKAIYNNRISL